MHIECLPDDDGYILRQTSAVDEVRSNRFFVVSASKVAKISVLCSTVSPFLARVNVPPPTMGIIIVHIKRRFNIICAYCNNNNNTTTHKRRASPPPLLHLLHRRPSSTPAIARGVTKYYSRRIGGGFNRV